MSLGRVSRFWKTIAKHLPFSPITPYSLFRHSNNIRETVVHGSGFVVTECHVSLLRHQMQNLWIYYYHFAITISSPQSQYYVKHGISREPPISSTAFHAVYIGDTGRPLRTRCSHWQWCYKPACCMPDILILAITLFQIRTFELSVPFLVATI
jgi:hypothetical protein